ncbi:multidrug efflux SMR transporter [Corynebacterium sp. HS2168-gen11]|uniref:DMT family transporter n=1 Tax=Corynebacterium sp. HS2168-gen11 TaxID=2974027 RepID=UPI00216ABD71|nr:SMR family transporter [Corynebacterium sp. HS2168-gen11]MCS4535265.1 SMR family transporter [Corynebacterium sp. HS2168-gen11]
MSALYLIGAILCEVLATLGLKVAASGKRIVYVGVVVGYVCAFSLLSQALRYGMAIGIAYGLWTACGVALTAICSHFFFREHLTTRMSLGIGCIMLGVLLVEIGA